MNDFTKMVVLGMARAAVMAFGGWMIANGNLDASAAGQVEGSLICLIGVGWTLAAKAAIAGKISSARAEVPPGYVPAGSEAAAAPAPQASMAPIANP